MKPGRGKEKGSNFEREVGKRFSLWLSEGQRKDLICRTVLSGGQFTLSGSGNPGDLMAQHPLAFKFFEKFILECKHWKDVKMIRFLAKDDDLYKALKKVEKQAQEKNKFYMLIVRQNHQKIMVFIPAGASPYFPGWSTLSHHLLFDGKVILFYLNQFLSTVKADFE